MPLPSKPLDQIVEDDLLAMTKAGEAESKIIDYKAALPGNADSERKEFLYDVSSFANASGGHLVFGMKAQDGIPTELSGIEKLSADAEKLRLHNMVQSGIQPGIPGVEVQDVKLKDGKSALLVRIPRSWASPHMVTFQAASRFYSRNSAGKYPLDVSEIRAAFLLSETISDRIRELRSSRLAAVLASETPVQLRPGQKLVMHIMPLSSFSRGVSIDLIRAYKLPSDIGKPIHVVSGWNHQYTFDGIVFYEDFNASPSLTYTQLFRSGCIELVDVHSLSHQEGKKLFYATEYERIIVEYVPTLFSMLKQVQVEPPFVISLSFLGVRGFGIQPDGRDWLHHPRAIDRDNLIIPEAMVETFEVDVPSVMKPLFDPVWNACGYPGSPNYDQSGKWRRSRSN